MLFRSALGDHSDRIRERRVRTAFSYPGARTRRSIFSASIACPDAAGPSEPMSRMAGLRKVMLGSHRPVMAGCGPTGLTLEQRDAIGDRLVADAMCAADVITAKLTCLILRPAGAGVSACEPFATCQTIAEAHSGFRRARFALRGIRPPFARPQSPGHATDKGS